MPARVFLLSPASCSGNRARLLLAPSSRLPLAEQLRSGSGAPIGDVFSFISQLYFRGKLTYARAFARPPGDPGASASPDEAGVLVITTSRGLVSPATRVDLDALAEFAAVALDKGNDAYARPLEEGMRRLAAGLGEKDEVVLLGSVATDKYVGILTEVLGPRLYFPREFAGRGDMSRGGLLLRCAHTRRELDYVPVIGSGRHGPRPPRLDPAERVGVGAPV